MSAMVKTEMVRIMRLVGNDQVRRSMSERADKAIGLSTIMEWTVRKRKRGQFNAWTSKMFIQPRT
jgi:hypothetical protein